MRSQGTGRGVLLALLVSVGTAGCLDGVAPGDQLTVPTAYELVSIDGVALPAVYFQQNDSTARVYADTLAFNPTSATAGTFGEVFRIGITVGDGDEEMVRTAADLRGSFTVFSDSVEIFAYGGRFRGTPPGGESLVLYQPFRDQIWRYRQIQ